MPFFGSKNKRRILKKRNLNLKLKKRIVSFLCLALKKYKIIKKQKYNYQAVVSNRLPLLVIFLKVKTF